jgi:acetyl esterase/lipase
VTALGHSAGGQLALWLASQSRYDFAEAYAPVRIARVVALAPVTDLRGIAEAKKGMVREVMGGTPSSVPSATPSSRRSSSCRSACRRS